MGKIKTWLLRELKDNNMLRTGYFFGTFFGGIALFFLIGWWAFLVLLLAQSVYIVWVMWADDSFSMVEAQVIAWKANRKEQKSKDVGGFKE